jgi:hypothetical protein
MSGTNDGKTMLAEVRCQSHSSDRNRKMKDERQWV